jgi:mannose-1-phosphate guanylyltransferase/mannose-1-phosphate guanylyltransferase/mannose-6-phosphate isomerase
MPTPLNTIIPVILSGGAGTRLWPMSRESTPKQLLPLASTRSMLQDTALRFSKSPLFASPIVVTNDSLRFSVAEQLSDIGVKWNALLLEPVGRGTAPAVAAAALLALESDPGAVLMVVPSDHLIQNVPAFLNLIASAYQAACEGYLVTFSVVPTRPETGYGYIRRGEGLPNHTGIHALAGFIEKPDAKLAKDLLAAGDSFWNSGMFLLSAAGFIAELERHAPDVLSAVRTSIGKRRADLDFVRLDPDSFAASPNISIDYAVMEKTNRAATIACDIGWTDLGAWSELWSISDKDSSGNVMRGDVIAEKVENCYLRSEGQMIAAVGVENLIVVVTDDAVLVANRNQAQDLRMIIDRLRKENRPELTNHRRVYRPWGYYESVDEGDRFQVKRLMVKPGAKLSLQKHFHRAEHWVVVSGTALVTRDDEKQMLHENESIYIPLGAVHRLENPGKIPLYLIEVQSGPYLGEDDIVRIEDTYGRTPLVSVKG